jgi:hypothetical protein
MSDLAALDDSLSDLLQTDAQLAAGAEEQLRMVREELQNVRAQLTAANARATGMPLSPLLLTLPHSSFAQLAAYMQTAPHTRHHSSIKSCHALGTCGHALESRSGHLQLPGTDIVCQRQQHVPP